MRTIELLAPARDAAVGKTAIAAGADAVYIGAPAFGARAAAGNSIADIAELVRYAHRFRARVYVTMNTILFDSELSAVRDMVWQLYSAGVDALIVQDMAYLEMDLPPIALHASTQCDIRTPQKAALLARAGFAQLVLPREFTLEEIKACSEAAGVPVEVFVHGALCVSYSGDCQAGQIAMGRSANRGVCPQMCRLPYRLVDESGRDVGPEKHYLSLRDLCRIDSLGDLIDAGATSFKIEGRLKDARYVANVTAAYSRALDKIVAERSDIVRASCGASSSSFVPDLMRTFNRGYTSYFLRSPRKAGAMASLDTPKWAGMEVGRVEAVPRNSRFFTARLTQQLANGDGLGYFDASGKFCGFRLNRIDGNRLFPASHLDGLRAGTVIYRNSDKAFFDILDQPDASCKRELSLEMKLFEPTPGIVALELSDSRGCSATPTVSVQCEAARSPQTEARARTLARMGDTIYTVAGINDTLGDKFLPASVLTALRRDAVAALDAVAEATYVYDRRKPSTLPSDAFAGVPPLTYHDNVANKLARRFYTSHGAVIGAPAAEVQTPRKETSDGITVMTTRYCIRRELGACLRDPAQARKLPARIFLANASGTYRLLFDCDRCGMRVVKQ